MKIDGVYFAYLDFGLFLVPSTLPLFSPPLPLFPFPPPPLSPSASPALLFLLHHFPLLCLVLYFTQTACPFSPQPCFYHELMTQANCLPWKGLFQAGKIL